MVHVTKSAMERRPIWVPSIPEQRRIVAILDEIFEGIAAVTANAQKNLANLSSFFVQYLHTVFEKSNDEWVETTVGNSAEHVLGKMLDKQKNKGDLKPYLRNINVRWFEFDLSDLLEMRFEPDEEPRYSAVKGDLLICEGGYPGRSAVWDRDEPIYIQKALHRVRFKNPNYAKLLNYYLFYLDSSGKLVSHFTGAGIQHFTGQVLARLPIRLPPRHRIGDIIFNLDAVYTEAEALKAVDNKKLSALSELKQSILARAFAGELTSTDDIAA